MSEPTDHGPVHGHSWRNEVVSRVQQHRARRGKGANSSQALEFDFATDEALTVTDAPVIRHRFYRARVDDAYGPANDISAGAETVLLPEPPKIIRFPRTASLPVDDPPHHLIGHATDGEFAEETSPRIFEVAESGEQNAEHSGPADAPQQARPVAQPEQMELLPSFEDIQLEPGHAAPQLENEVIPMPAGLAQRLIAGAVDISMVGAAVVLFGSAFVRLAHDNPHYSRMALLCGLCVAGLLWLILQYLFLVHGKGTPGMRFAQLELATFDGKPVDANSRRCRAAASALSAFSVGLGYAWALVDEDRLGWHDRITGTLVRSSAEPAVRGAEIWTDFMSGF